MEVRNEGRKGGEVERLGMKEGRKEGEIKD